MTWGPEAWKHYDLAKAKVNINPEAQRLECDLIRADGTIVTVALSQYWAEQIGKLALTLRKQDNGDRCPTRMQPSVLPSGEYGCPRCDQGDA